MECFIMSGNQTNVTKDKLWISLLGVICAICLVLVFLITAIEAVVYWTPGYFEAEYTKYQVLDHLPPMTMEDLLIVTDEMMAYLRGNRADLHVFTTLGGQHMEFFNAREIAHMEDVRDLLSADFGSDALVLQLPLHTQRFLYSGAKKIRSVKTF